MAKDTKTKDDAGAGAMSSVAKGSRDSIVNFSNGIEIYSQHPLPEYNSGGNKAFKAERLGKTTDDLIAIVCEPHVIPRRNAIPVYASFINPALVPVVGHGKVYWPPAREERYVIIYKHVLGSRLLKADQPQAMGWKQDMVMESVVKPMVTILDDFRSKDFFHGAISPSNMFDGGGQSKAQKFVLGDCLSAQGSYNQSVLFEPIERGFVQPSARGVGTLTDDIYAFGVTLAVMMRGQDPLAGKTDEEIIIEKLNVGSYAAVTGKYRFKGSILELLRGLLHDDPTQRWTLDEIQVWLDGRRLTPKQALTRKKAARPFPFAGVRYTQTPLLAMALDSYPSETVKIVDDGSLEQWLARSLEDDETVARLKEAKQYSIQGGRGAGYSDRLVANVSNVLDPMGPIRFRGQKMSGYGIGSALYEALVLKQDVKIFSDMFLQSIAMNWVTSSENPNIDVGGLISKYDACKGYLRNNKLGFGLERCLYVLNVEAPCLSPKIAGHYVSTPEDLMYAFESVCKKGELPPLFLDRHSAAFLSVKDDRLIDPYLFDLNAAEDYKNLIGNLKCLATIQKRSKMEAFPNIAKAFNRRMPVIYRRFHDRKVREKLKEAMGKHVLAGDLVKMSEALDNPELTAKDVRGFRQAMHEYHKLRNEKKLEYQLQDEKTFGKTTGKEIAAMVSGVISIFVIIFIAFSFLKDATVLY
jgi:serine/threonine protein kinase